MRRARTGSEWGEEALEDTLEDPLTGDKRAWCSPSRWR